MRRIARATAAMLAALVVVPAVADAEPMVLTATQMDSVTAAARPFGVNININVTTQIVNAFAFSFATCGVCVGGGPSASSFAVASNANATGQLIRR